MKNLFEQMGRPTKEDLQWEEVGGTFACQERFCYEQAHEAKYSKPLQVLTWKCQENHISKIENFNID